MTWRPWCAALAVAGLTACGRTPPPAIELALGEDGGAVRQLVPKSAWAEHLLIPGSKNELRLVLASGEASCHGYVAPGADELRLTVTVTSPLDQPIGPGVYPWSEPAPSPDGDAPAPRAAVPKVLIGGRSFQPPPGGGVELLRVDPSPQGTVTGVLGFAFPGTGSDPASSIKGAFSARSCSAQGAPAAR